MIKKHWKKILITIIVLMLLSTGVGAVIAYADYVLNATQVTYDKDGNTIAVNEALDDLYTKTQEAQQALQQAQSDLIVNHYGKIVTGYGVEGTWRLFYTDDENAYLIRDSIGNYRLDKLSSWGSSISDLGKSLNSKYTYWNSASKQDNIKGVAALTDTTKWTQYVEPGVADWAIGAPSLEMFVASYNKTHTKQIDCRVTSSNGYQVGINTSGGEVTSFGANIRELGTGGELDNAIYCSGDWWLASPSSYSSNYVMRAHDGNGGGIGSALYSIDDGERRTPSCLGPSGYDRR